MISSFEVYCGPVSNDARELGEGGGRSGSSGRAPGPAEVTDRRRRFLQVVNRRTER